MGNDEVTHDEPAGELEIEGSDSPCSYLPGQTAKMTYRLAYKMSESRYEQLLSRGWRRFGRTLFRPSCAACSACRSLRVTIPEFTASKSQRRVLAKTPALTLIVQKPTVSEEHIALYNRYHLDMHQRRQWPFRSIDGTHYFDSFIDGHFSFAREFQYRHDGKLIGLGLVDVTRTVMSSIYFFHDPEWRDAALGTYSVLREIEDGRQHGRQWLYMGYYIRDCGSMNYKNRYRPNQLLQHYVADAETPDWRRADDSGGSDNADE
jgi:arginine-tRNA-protein transferase